MVQLSIVWVWIVCNSIHLAISMDKNPEKILKETSRLQGIEPSRKISTARGDMTNICSDSSSICPDPSARPTPKRQKSVLSHNQSGGCQSLENREGGSKLATAALSHENLYSSSSERFASDIYKSTGLCAIPHHRGLEQNKHYPVREMILEPNQGSMDHTTSLKFYESKASQDKFNTRTVESARKVMESESSIRRDSEPRASDIDIKEFHLHNPDKMCSAAAIHYTKDLMSTLSDRYSPRAKLSHYPSWELGKEIWTSERLLPFVYFIVSCNPSRKLWRYIKHLTILILRTYHRYSIKTETLSNQEKHTKFILWHTEVIYHTVLMKPMVKSSSQQMRVYATSTLAKVFFLLNDDHGFERSASHKYCRNMLERHISGTFEEDYKLGYPVPITVPDQNNHDLTLENWNKKSNEIKDIGRFVDWSKFLKLVPDESEPVLLTNQDIETLKKDPKLKVFMTYWEKDLKKMLLYVKPLQSTNLALLNISPEEICKGLHGYIKKKTQKLNIHGPTEFQVTLFAGYLHRKSNDQSFDSF